MGPEVAESDVSDLFAHGHILRGRKLAGKRGSGLQVGTGVAARRRFDLSVVLRRTLCTPLTGGRPFILTTWFFGSTLRRTCSRPTPTTPTQSRLPPAHECSSSAASTDSRPTERR